MSKADVDLDVALLTVRRAVEAAARLSLEYFRTGVAVELKSDRSPVTAADRDSENAIVAVIRAAFPGHAILGEETGAHAAGAGGRGSRWIIDPLDGTRGFTRGDSFWGPLVALEHEGDVVAGAMALPVAGRVYFSARGKGSWVSTDGDPPRRLGVSTIARWEDATFSMGEPRIVLAPPLGDSIARLATTCARARCYGDLAGFEMVLAGRAEAWIEAGVQVWDLAPMKILIEEAGGRFTDLAGRATIASGGCVVSNGLVHDHVLTAIGTEAGRAT